MSRRFLLDSNAIIDHIGGVRRLPDAVAKSEAMLVSQIAVAEVKAGFDDTLSLEFEGMEDPREAVQLGFEYMQRFVSKD